MTSTRKSRGAMAAASAGVLAALVAGSLTTPASAAPAKAPAGCPAAVPMSTVAPGMTGEALTVVKGNTPEAFKVEVVGVLDDGISVGKDLIIVSASDYPGQNVFGEGGQIWAGMSGSPVYVDGKLLGALAWGFTASSSPLAGVTPAEDMYELLDLPAQQAKVKALKEKTTVTLSAATKAKLAKRAGVAAPQGALQKLRTPLGVSGVSSERINRLQSDADAAGWSVRTYPASRQAAPAAAAAPAAKPEPGGNFAAMLSYGDFSVGGLGTTTAVCEDKALAFGHWFNRVGPSAFGANDASTLAIVKDQTYGSFKMANFGASLGTVDQDRTSGIRANLTETPDLAQLTTDITNGDTGRQREGTTSVVDQTFLSSALAYSIWGNYDKVYDEWADGVATSDWTINGTRAGGAPFTLSRDNRWADQADVTVPPVFEIAEAADSLIYNEYEPVTIKDVTFTSTAKTKFDQLSITKLAVSVNGGKYTSPKRLTVKVGDKLKLRVALRPYRSTTTKTTTLALTVPKSARGQSALLSATGGLDLGYVDEEFDTECLLEGNCEEAEEGSLDKLLKSLDSTPRNDAVVANLQVEDEEQEVTTTVATATKLKTRVVNGSRSIPVAVRR